MNEFWFLFSLYSFVHVVNKMEELLVLDCVVRTK